MLSEISPEAIVVMVGGDREGWGIMRARDRER